MDALTLRELQEFDPHGGRGGGEDRRYLCPLCGQDKPRDAAHRCLVANHQSGLWECKRCKAKGKLRERWEERPQITPRERRQRALHQAFALPPEEPAPPEDPEGAPWRDKLRGLQPLAGTPGAEYLASRGIPLDVATSAGVRFSPTWYGRPAAVFAFRDGRGGLVAAQGRCVDGKEPGKLTAGPIGRGVFFGPGARQALDTDPGAPVALVEAPIDALSLAVAGLPALALAGTSGKSWLPRALAFRRVLLALDADVAGDSAAAVLAGELQALGARCERLRPGGAKDWNEALQRAGAEALRAALAGVLEGSEQPAPTDPPAEQPEVCACGGEVVRYGPDGTPLCFACATGRCPRCLRVLPLGQSACPACG